MQMAFDLSPDGIYDITSIKLITILDVAPIIADAAGANVTLGDYRGFAPFTPICGRAPRGLPEVDLEEGLPRLIDELRNWKHP